jgi:hypothetical protein
MKIRKRGKRGRCNSLLNDIALLQAAFISAILEKQRQALLPYINTETCSQANNGKRFGFSAPIALAYPFQQPFSYSL